MLIMIATAWVLGATPALISLSPAGERVGERADGPSDGGPADAGIPDASTSDGGLTDAGRPDAGHLDAGHLDAGRLDAGHLDAGRLDAGRPDAGRPDAGLLDAGRPDAASEGPKALSPTLSPAGEREVLGRPDAGRVLDGGVADGGRPGGEAAFLFFPAAPSAADGTVVPPQTELSGPGASMVKYAAQQLASRERELASGQRSLGVVSAALDRFFKTSGGESPRVQRDELARLAATTLEQARMAYLAAADHERRRLAWVVKVVRDAQTNEEANPLPGVDLALATARLAAVRDGRVRTAIDARIGGYRGLLLGIVAWVDGDTYRSLEQLKLGVAGAPDLPLAHLYLGYLHYVLENVRDAMAEWGKALELDPTNETIKKLIADHLNELKPKKK